MDKPWRERPDHRRWLRGEADRLFRFYEANSLDAAGGFFTLDDAGAPMAAVTERPLHQTARMAHCAAIGALLGRPGASDLLDHAMDALWTRHRDAAHGGYFWSFDAEGPRERSKLAYGHAFVLLAASSAKCAGHPDADRLIADIAEVLNARFWEARYGASAEEFGQDWTPFSDYRGQNANMHLTEALMAAYEATAEADFLARAESIADLILNRRARAADWRVPEHYHADWTVDGEYRGSDMFRPFGYTPGHALEWTRLALQLWALGGRRLAWLPEAAAGLFAQAVAQGWDARGGLYYTLNYDAAPRVRDRLWWPICEGVGAAHFLGSGASEVWYRRFWDFAARRLIDARHGGWHCQLDDDLSPIPGYFAGKPDIYHALQACLIPLYGVEGSLTREIGAGAR
ncbi:MAG TPA: AGE family epimerase/isomerase [Roseiarcus sp.]|nr:AGE family epimerase/isomerase [Roseiarcus sp.]